MTRGLVAVENYPELIENVKNEIAQGRQAMRHQQALTYWRVGRHIHRYILQGKDRADYGGHLYEQLEKDLHISADTLKRTVQFYREFPIRAPVPELGWAKYRALLTVKNKNRREQLYKKAISRKLTKEQLMAQIKKEKAPKLALAHNRQNQSPVIPIPQLAIQRGRLFTYQIVGPRSPSLTKDSLWIDCGFDIRWPIPVKQAKDFKKEDIVESILTQDKYSLRPSRADKGGLFTYKAFLEKVVDGDTVWFEIDCGFNIIVRQKLRLNSVDCPEISTATGREAKRFLEDELKKCDFVIIKTYSHDQYDRYLVDIFYSVGKYKTFRTAENSFPTQQRRYDARSEEFSYLTGEKDVAKVVREGRLLNQKLLDRGLAVKWK